MQRHATDYGLPTSSVDDRFDFPARKDVLCVRVCTVLFWSPFLTRNTCVSKGLGPDSDATTNRTRHVWRYPTRSVYREATAFGQDRARPSRDPLTANVFITGFLFFHLINRRSLACATGFRSTPCNGRWPSNIRSTSGKRRVVSYDITSQNCSASVAHGTIDAPLSPLQSSPSHLAL